MYIDYFSIGFLVIAIAMSSLNIYLMFMIQKQLKSDLISKSFDLLRKEVSLLNQKQDLHQTQATLDASRIKTLENIMSHIISSSGGLDGSDGGTLH
jgi:uncharacterized protein YoxC